MKFENVYKNIKRAYAKEDYPQHLAIVELDIDVEKDQEKYTEEFLKFVEEYKDEEFLAVEHPRVAELFHIFPLKGSDIDYEIPWCFDVSNLKVKGEK